MILRHLLWIVLFFPTLAVKCTFPVILCPSQDQDDTFRSLLLYLQLTTVKLTGCTSTQNLIRNRNNFDVLSYIASRA